MFKRILVVFGIAALAVGSTWAYFSATADSADNVVTAGTLTFGSPEDFDFSVANASPGSIYEGDENPYNVGNGGTIDANHIEMTVANAVTDFDGDADPDMDEMLLVNKMTYGTVDLKAVIEGNPDDDSWDNGIYGVKLESGSDFGTLLNGDGKITLARWAGESIEVNDDPGTIGAPPAGLAASTLANFDLDLQFDPSAGNEYQGDSVNSTLTFTLNQDASQ